MRRMSAADFPRLTKAELFARLAEGPQADVSVITPNRRLAQELAREFDADRIAGGLKVWEAADILPFGSFVERLWESAVYSELGAGIPLLLSAAQEQALWEEIVEASEWGGQLLAPARAAAQCRDAWRLAHAWQIEGALDKFPGNDDARAFAGWANVYARRSTRDVDFARLSDVVAKLLTSPAIAKPRQLVVYAFDILPAQTIDFLRAAAAAGIAVTQCGPRRRDAQVIRATYPSARDELEAAARALGAGQARSCEAAKRVRTCRSRAAHRGRRARPRTTPAGGAAGFLARHGTGLEPARRDRQTSAVQHFNRRAAG